MLLAEVLSLVKQVLKGAAAQAQQQEEEEQRLHSPESV
jgi:hypothetical protein